MKICATTGRKSHYPTDGSCYLDRTSVDYAAIGMSRELGFTDRVVGMGVGVFFIICGLADSRCGFGGTLERAQDDFCDYDRVGIDDDDDGSGAQKPGRFELADKGTLFLDEVGDIPAALQPKLLRVLQEQEFERLGSTRTHKVDVRLVAATHRNLQDMVLRDQFRSDLYYRINVFPILLPPLRARRQDIQPLVMHFVEKFTRRIDKQVGHIPQDTMSALTRYEWPGNIRELQNVIERAVILSNDGVLPNPLASSRTHCPTVPPIAGTLKDVERTAILQAHEYVGWVIGGPKGAAAKLGVARTTLIHRMEKLGIHRPRDIANRSEHVDQLP